MAAQKYDKMEPRDHYYSDIRAKKRAIFKKLLRERGIKWKDIHELDDFIRRIDFHLKVMEAVQAQQRFNDDSPVSHREAIEACDYNLRRLDED